jgi:Domain of unknown function (DUF1844)
MDEEKDSSRGFRVTDRRRFSDEGEARQVEGEARQVEGEARQVDEAPEPFPAPDPSAQEPAAHGIGTSPEEPVSFSTFVLGLSTQALLHLGEIDDPATGRVERDLAAAKHVIDILGILKDKTRRNLEQAEERLLEAVLYDLRMKYVEIVRGSKEGA